MNINLLQKGKYEKKILFTFFCLFIMCWLLKPQANPVYLSSDVQLFHGEIKSSHEILQIIHEINDKNELIKNIFVKRMPITIQQGSMKGKVFGELAMEKPKNFRLKISHELFGQEMDIGSNDTLFWFWSKRLNPPILNYAAHENFKKSNLKMILSPNWMLECLNANRISTENIEFGRFKNFWLLLEDKEEVTIATLIEPSKKQIVGRYLYNEKGKLIASAEYSNFNDQIPKNILIIWYEERIIMKWDLSEMKINSDINHILWIMPEKENMNIGK
jgi:hypothetical protein